MIPYQFLSLKKGTPATGYWDHALITDIFKDPLFINALEVKEAQEGSIIVIPGPYQAEKINEINEYLNRYKWVVLIITSDEENKFPVEKIKHPNIKIYLQYPKKGRHDVYGKLPLGYTSDTRKYLKLDKKQINWFFAGQLTHERRRLCIEALRTRKDGSPITTGGFSQGLDSAGYIDFMNRSKVAPCPAGPISADSFRTYEAMEAGAIPIADNISIGGDRDYWSYLLDSVPFPTINDYSDLLGYIDDQLEDFQTKANRIQAWWIKYKRDIKYKFINDVLELSGNKYSHEITVIIPSSTIPSHPSIEIIDETIKSIRHHLPDSEIIITFDGLRPEYSKRKEDYQEYIRHALFMCNTKWGNTVPIIFDEFTHQAEMARVALEDVKTPLVLYVEQDTPLVTDMDIDWDKIMLAIENGESNMVRFHFESFIPKEHKHLMIGEPKNELQKTAQWSQRPHLASTIFYKRIIEHYFTPDSRCFIEDLIHGKLHEDYKINGIMGWNQWRVHIYHPEGIIKRSVHTDGRAGDKKFDNTQIW